MQYDLSLYGRGQVIELNDFRVVFAVPFTPMLCYDCDVPVAKFFSPKSSDRVII